MLKPTPEDDLASRLVAEHGSGLLRYIARRGAGRSEVHDIAQETYLRLLRVQHVDLIENPQAYVYRIATNLLYDLRLKRRNADEALQRLLNEPTRPSEAVSAERSVEQLELRERLEEALATLSPKCRAVVILHRRDGMTYDEIGHRLGISSSMVKKYLGIGIRMCREHLRAKGYGP